MFSNIQRSRMAYFPMFIDMAKCKVLIVGGGKIASEKLEKLLEFSQDITLLSLTFDEKMLRLIEENTLPSLHRAYQKGDIDGFDMVIVATNTIDLHQAIYEESRGKRVWVNSVDDTAYCDFIFPSYVKEESLTIAFSTGGASPAFAKHIRQYFETKIPKSVGAFLKEMKALRQSMPKGKERMHYFERRVSEYFHTHFR